MQYEFELNDWRAMSCAPMNATWIQVKTRSGIYRAHFAEDLSGSDQPAFSGWFIEIGTGRGSYFEGLNPSPHAWRPLVT